MGSVIKKYYQDEDSQNSPKDKPFACRDCRHRRKHGCKYDIEPPTHEACDYWRCNG